MRHTYRLLLISSIILIALLFAVIISAALNQPFHIKRAEEVADAPNMTPTITEFIHSLQMMHELRPHITATTSFKADGALDMQDVFSLPDPLDAIAPAQSDEGYTNTISMLDLLSLTVSDVVVLPTPTTIILPPYKIFEMNYNEQYRKYVNMGWRANLSGVKDKIGIQINGCDTPNVEAMFDDLRKIGFKYVKQQVRLGDIYHGYHDYRCFDRLVDMSGDIQFIWSIVTTPRQYRPANTKTVYGPPSDLDYFRRVVSELVARYRHKTIAVEIWNEPNLGAEWEEGVSPAGFAKLLKTGYYAVKSVAPEIIVISGALAPFPFPTVGMRVYNDEQFMMEMYQAYGMLWADCIGYHANGHLHEQYVPGVIERYKYIISKFIQPARLPICITEFSYSLPVNGAYPDNFKWVKDHTEEQQANMYYHWLRAISNDNIVGYSIIFNYNYNDGITPNSIASLTAPGRTGLTLQVISDFFREHENK